MDNFEKIIEIQEQVVTDNRDLIVKLLEPDDLVDELIQKRLLGRSGAQRVQLPGTSREEKNRIICEQLTTAGPDALNKFCEILRKNKRQTFIAERQEKCEYQDFLFGFAICYLAPIQAIKPHKGHYVLQFVTTVKGNFQLRLLVDFH